MSVSDPLLKQLKGVICELRSESCAVTDTHHALQQLCITLEMIYRKGLKKSLSLFGTSRRDYWHCVQGLLAAERHSGKPINPMLVMTLETVQSAKMVSTVQGRGRYFIRLCLQRRLLWASIQAIRATQQIIARYSAADSILGDEILSEILASLLYEVSDIRFQLNTDNASFLDETWIMPVCQKHELVPCARLGLRVQHVDGRILVVGVDEDGVASEDSKISAGDVITELLDETLRDVSTNKVSSILKLNNGRPITLSVTKGYLSEGSMFPPIEALVQKLGHSIESLHNVVAADAASDSTNAHKVPPHAQLVEHDYDEVPVHNSSDVATYNVKYIGNQDMGAEGTMDFIAKAVVKVLDAEKDTPEGQLVTLELGEADISISDPLTKQTLFCHSFTMIASCGRRADCVEHFCYIVGETQCTFSTRFTAYVFQADNEEEARIILYSLAQGFQRTHWCV